MHTNPIKKWHQVVKNNDFQLLEDILDDSVIFYSPVVFTPQKGKKITLMYLSAVATLFNVDSFSYTHEIINKNIMPKKNLENGFPSILLMKSLIKSSKFSVSEELI